jgi:hypothetical protein
MESNKKSKKDKILLPTVTLAAATSPNIIKTLWALKQSMAGINFAEVILISHRKPFWLNKKIKFIKCKPINSLNAYNHFIAYELYQYIKTDFTLVVQYDGYVLRPWQWDNEFLDYDYIGAPWPKGMFHTNEGVEVRVGNGGFSLRSKKLLNILNELNLPFTDNGTGYYNEDGIICNYYRKKLEDAGIKYAPVEIASKFSHEIDCDDSYPEPFGFHKKKK